MLIMEEDREQMRDEQEDRDARNNRRMVGMTKGQDKLFTFSSESRK